MILWASIGGAVGLVLGITGAGGSMTAVPLLMHAAGMDVHRATVFSLIAVFLSSSLNWVVQRRATDLTVSFIMAPFSFLGAIVFAPLKAASPAWVIKALFIGVITLALATVWRNGGSPRREAAPVTRRKPGGTYYFGVSAAGGILGGVCTMTGLGGGAVMLPMLMGPLGMTMKHAVSTSLLTQTLAALGAAWIQRRSVAETFSGPTVLALTAGIVVAAKAVQMMTVRLPAEKMDLVRRVVLTAVIAASAVGMIAG